MKVTKSIIVIVLATIVAYSCGTDNKNNQAEDQQTDQTNENNINKNEMSGATSGASVKPDSITISYLKLKNSLVASDAEQAGLAAQQLQKALASAEYHNESKLAASIADDETLESQRKIFQTLSKRIYELASDQKITFNTLYKQYCPMAFDNTGAFWLSSSKAIRNPYFGDKMLKCGRVQETLAKK